MRKNLYSLLKKLEESQVYSNEQNISSLNDALSKQLNKGGYDITNGTCHGTINSGCYNIACTGTTNSMCFNEACLT